MQAAADPAGPAQNAAATALLLRSVRQAQLRLLSTQIKLPCSNNQLQQWDEQAVAADDCDPHSLQALVTVTAAAATASEAAAVLELMVQELVVQQPQRTEVVRYPARDAAGKAAADAARLLQDCLDALEQYAQHTQQHQDALKAQRDIISRAADKRQAAADAAAAAAAAQANKSQTRTKTIISRTKDALPSSSRLLKRLSKYEQGKPRKASADRKKALPAGTYLQLVEGALQRKQATQQAQLGSKQGAAGAAKKKPDVPKQRQCSASERLSTMLRLMSTAVSPYNLACSHAELARAALQSLPWLWRSRSQLEQVEVQQFNAVVEKLEQHRQTVSTLSGRSQAAAVAAMSRAARQHLLLFYSRNILVADDQVSTSSSHAAKPRETRPHARYPSLESVLDEQLRASLSTGGCVAVSCG